jgi:peptide/nickel transport system substrate-binding protein
VWLGYATQAKSIITSSYPGYDGSFWKYTLDYDEAKRLLAEAGYPDGFETTIEINAAIPQDEQIAIILKDSFKKIGVDLVIERVQAGDFYTKGNLKTFKGMYIFQDMAGVVDGGFSIKLWLQCPRGTAAQPSNFSGYCNEEVQRLYDETTETLDQELRNKNFARIQEITVWEEPAWILLTEPGYHIAIRDDINGLFWQTLQEIRWGKMYRE